MHVRVKGSDPLIMSTFLLTRRETGFIFTPGWGKKSVCVFCFSFLKQKTSLEIRQSFGWYFKARTVPCLQLVQLLLFLQTVIEMFDSFQISWHDNEKQS